MGREHQGVAARLGLGRLSAILGRERGPVLVARLATAPFGPTGHVRLDEPVTHVHVGIRNDGDTTAEAVDCVLLTAEWLDEEHPDSRIGLPSVGHRSLPADQSDPDLPVGREIFFHVFDVENRSDGGRLVRLPWERDGGIPLEERAPGRFQCRVTARNVSTPADFTVRIQKQGRLTDVYLVSR